MQTASGVEGSCHQGHHALPIVDADGVGSCVEEGRGVGGGRMTADENRASRALPSNECRDVEHGLGFERVHAGDADETWSSAVDEGVERLAEAQVGHRHPVSVRLERRGDVLQPERLDPEERPQAETLVARHRSQQENVHRHWLVEAYTDPRPWNKVAPLAAAGGHRSP